MTDKPIGIIGTSYLCHLAEGSRILGSTALIDLMFEKYDLRMSEVVKGELDNSTFGLDPIANETLIATIRAKISTVMLVKTPMIEQIILENAIKPEKDDGKIAGGLASLEAANILQKQNPNIRIIQLSDDALCHDPNVHPADFINFREDTAE